MGLEQSARIGEGRRALLTAIVVDDDFLSRRRVLDLLSQEPDISVMGDYEDAEAAIDAINARRPEIVFLDIEMPGMSGFKVVERVSTTARPAFIFVSAHASYAIRAFDQDVVDFVLKPFDSTRFARALQRVRDRVAGSAAQDHEPVRYAERLTIKCEGRILPVRVADIDWIESSRNYVRLHMGRETHTTRDTLAGIEARLDPLQFARIHRATIVNVDRIVHLTPSFRREHVVTLRDGTRLILGFSYRENLRRASCWA